MTVVQPNSISGINSITVQSGQSLSVYQSDGSYGQIRANGGNLILRADEGNTVGSSIINFEIDGSERVRITSGGGVGINTDTLGTNHNLEILGNASAYAVLNVKSKSLSHGAVLELGAQDDDNYGSITQFASGASEGGRMAFVAGTTETMNLRGGKLLVGTTASKASGSGQYGVLNVSGRIGATTGEAFMSLSRGEVATTMSADDEVANLTFNDLTGYEFARIQVLADAATGTTDTPGRIVFSTTADGASSATERMRIDSSGRVDIGASAAVTQTRNLNIGSDSEANLAIETHNDATSESANIRFYKSGNTGASPQVVETDDVIARLQAYGYDGTDYNNQACGIDFMVDGAPGSNDMPGKILFKTTADGGTSPSTRLTIAADGNATFSGTVSDAKGDLRKSYKNEQASTYTLVASDAGKVIGAQNTITVPASVFANGDIVTIVNYTAGNITITQGSSLTIYNSGDASTGSKTLATRGMATLWFPSGTTSYMSGTGIS